MSATLTVALGTAAAPAEARTLLVDNDRQQCRNAKHGSITAAVAAAQPGDKIKVCPGLYAESVVVDKPNLRLRGLSARRNCFDPTPASPDPTRDAIVTSGPQGQAISLEADGVRLRDFVVQGNNVGIRTSAAFSGYRVRDNLVQRNDFGLMLASSGERESRATRNCFRMNGRGPVGSGVFAVAPLAGALRDADIARNSFSQNTFGIRLGASRQVRVAHNRSLNDRTWMRNGGTVDLAVVHNIVRGATGASAGDAIVFFPLAAVAGGTPSVGALVSHNDLGGNGRDGVQVLPSGLVASVISHNKIHDNGRDGVRIESGGNADNVVRRNHLSANREHDCHDDTVGSGTAGTANLWEHNSADSENRPGLCRRGKGTGRQ